MRNFPPEWAQKVQQAVWKQHGVWRELRELEHYLLKPLVRRSRLTPGVCEFCCLVLPICYHFLLVSGHTSLAHDPLKSKPPLVGSMRGATPHIVAQHLSARLSGISLVRVRALFLKQWRLSGCGCIRGPCLRSTMPRCEVSRQILWNICGSWARALSSPRSTLLIQAS